jgi:hypothetical protein
VAVGPLDTQAAVRLFRAAAARFAEDRRINWPGLPDGAIEARIARDPALHPLPLYTTAAVIHAVTESTETFGLTGAQIIEALVERERRRLDAAGRNAGWGEHAASRLAGLASLRAGLDAPALRRLASPRLEIGLPPAEKIVDAVMSVGWWENDRMPAPSPDLVAAELLRQILLDRLDIAPEWLWETLCDPLRSRFGASTASPTTSPHCKHPANASWFRSLPKHSATTRRAQGHGGPFSIRRSWDFA